MSAKDTTGAGEAKNVSGMDRPGEGMGVEMGERIGACLGGDGGGGGGGKRKASPLVPSPHSPVVSHETPNVSLGTPQPLAG